MKCHSHSEGFRDVFSVRSSGSLRRQTHRKPLRTVGWERTREQQVRLAGGHGEQTTSRGRVLAMVGDPGDDAVETTSFKKATAATEALRGKHMIAVSILAVRIEKGGFKPCGVYLPYALHVKGLAVETADKGVSRSEG